eukprot:12998700-Alexandrium_andersonii.AAC.1
MPIRSSAVPQAALDREASFGPQVGASTRPLRTRFPQFASRLTGSPRRPRFPSPRGRTALSRAVPGGGQH